MREYSSDALYGDSGVFNIRQLYCCNIILFFGEYECKLRKIDHEYDTRKIETSVYQPNSVKNHRTEVLYLSWTQNL